MKQWVQKLLEQFDWNSSHSKEPAPKVDLNEDRATLLYIIDIYNKHLLEIDKQPVRKVRETLDTFAKGLVHPELPSSKDVLFKFRQFFASYRIDEYTYMQNTFDDFKKIVWDFADQLTEDLNDEKNKDKEIHGSLEQLKEAVESNSIELLRSKSKEFIQFYMTHQSKKAERRDKRMTHIKKNLNTVKKQLMEAQTHMQLDHLTQVYNRMSFDEQTQKCLSLSALSKTPITMIVLDIDHFKKINDKHGHDIGDFVLKECAHTIKKAFNKEGTFVARIGGEEFAIILPDCEIQEAEKKAQEALQVISKEVFVSGHLKLSFTVSMGIAQLTENETKELWFKRADTALYESKNSGRNRLSLAPPHKRLEKVA